MKNNKSKNNNETEDSDDTYTDEFDGGDMHKYASLSAEHYLKAHTLSRRYIPSLTVCFIRTNAHTVTVYIICIYTMCVCVRVRLCVCVCMCVCTHTHIFATLIKCRGIAAMNSALMYTVCNDVKAAHIMASKATGM